MPDMALALASYQRSTMPQAVLQNCLTEKVLSKPSQPWAILARFGLEAFETLGTAPFRGSFQKDGLLGDATFVVASTGCYLIDAAGVKTTLTGTVAGDDPVIIDGGLDADGNSLLRVATGNALYQFVWSPTTGPGAVVAEAFPTTGGAGATSVSFWAGYWLATEAGTDYGYFIEPAGTTWGQLQFAAAEYQPDPLKGAIVVGETGWLLGSTTTEGWRLTGDATSAMEPLGGLKFDYGCRSFYSACNCQGDLIYVDNNGQVRWSQGGEPQVISDYGLTEQILATSAADLRAGFFLKGGHPLYVLHLGSNATWVFDLSTQRWSTFSSLTYDYWRPTFFATMGDTVLAFDRNSNVIWRLSSSMRQDADDVFTRKFCAFLEVPEGTVDLVNIELDILTGDSPRSGQGSDPVIGLRLSRDRGQTFGDVRYRPMGLTGEYTSAPRWNSLGMAKGPYGLVAQWELSDPVGGTVYGARANVP
jgi:hypothetical protein